ncbi:hypothetical protein C0Q70_11116 [Pomacea canaliculata]|uniref:Uncharacterized protein n=1 Tax=Pomacea canaliculata TaxID=400727 RepID=A0A2T7P543_POMCA|nr:hypothetical protein C0Q70_11116 [Pomacea canaliculata]
MATELWARSCLEPEPRRHRDPAAHRNKTKKKRNRSSPKKAADLWMEILDYNKVKQTIDIGQRSLSVAKLIHIASSAFGIGV